MAADENSGTKPAPVVLRIKLRYDDPETFVERFAPNIGRAGLFLHTKQPRPIGTEVRFELRLADQTAILVGTGWVKECREPDPERPRNPSGMMIAFTRVTRESRDLLLRVLERRRALALPDAPDGMPVIEPEELSGVRPLPSPSQQPPFGEPAAAAPVPAPPPEPLPAAVAEVAAAAAASMAAARSVADIVLPSLPPPPPPMPTIAASPLAPEPARRARPRPQDLIASAGTGIATTATTVDEVVDLASVIARAKTIVTGDLDAELESLGGSPTPEATPLPLTADEASSRLATLLGVTAARVRPPKRPRTEPAAAPPPAEARDPAPDPVPAPIVDGSSDHGHVLPPEVAEIAEAADSTSTSVPALPEAATTTPELKDLPEPPSLDEVDDTPVTSVPEVPAGWAPARGEPSAYAATVDVDDESTAAAAEIPQPDVREPALQLDDPLDPLDAVDSFEHDDPDTRQATRQPIAKRWMPRLDSDIENAIESALSESSGTDGFEIIAEADAEDADLMTANAEADAHAIPAAIPSESAYRSLHDEYDDEENEDAPVHQLPFRPDPDYAQSLVDDDRLHLDAPAYVPPPGDALPGAETLDSAALPYAETAFDQDAPYERPVHESETVDLGDREARFAPLTLDPDEFREYVPPASVHREPSYLRPYGQPQTADDFASRLDLDTGNVRSAEDFPPYRTPDVDDEPEYPQDFRAPSYRAPARPRDPSESDLYIPAEALRSGEQDASDLYPMPQNLASHLYGQREVDSGLPLPRSSFDDDFGELADPPPPPSYEDAPEDPPPYLSQSPPPVEQVWEQSRRNKRAPSPQFDHSDEHDHAMPEEPRQHRTGSVPVPIPVPRTGSGGSRPLPGTGSINVSPGSGPTRTPGSGPNRGPGSGPVRGRAGSQPRRAVEITPPPEAIDLESALEALDVDLGSTPPPIPTGRRSKPRMTTDDGIPIDFDDDLEDE